MCGIAAIIGAHTGALSRLAAMSDQIRHRGPDDEGRVYFLPERAIALGGPDTPDAVFQASLPYAPDFRDPAMASPEGAVAGLAHRRLAIIDCSEAGHQPMASADRRYWLTYNGEIYNYRELRDDLAERGHSFHTATDTEVILAAYAEWGPACLHRFNGMWAFVLIDRVAGRVFAARDRFGVKPLYYWVSPEGFLALASEIKQFTVLPGWRATLNGQRAYDFLAWGIQDHTSETLFRGVYQLRGGEAFETSLDHPSLDVPVYRWYDLKPQAFSGDLPEAAQAFHELFRDAVDLRLRADAPLGSCLSGGLDSSAIVCVANDLLTEKGETGLQKTFSACSEDKRFDEREYIDEVVRARNLDAHYAYPELDALFETLEAMIWHQDEPFGSTSIFAQWQVFELASRQGVRVMLDGQGADEQLAGYRSYLAPRLAGLLQSGQWTRLWSEARAAQALQGFSTLGVLKQVAHASPLGAFLHDRVKAGGMEGPQPHWLNMHRLAATPGNPALVNGAPARSIRALSVAQLTATHLPMLLHWEDRDSMAHSVESRLPFLDYRLVERVLGFPEAYKLSEGVSKRVMREAMRGILPERIRMRMDKMGFVTPEERWLREESPERFRQALAEAVSASQGILNESAIALLEGMIAGKLPFSFVLWRMISFGKWMERFDVTIEGKAA